MYTYIRTHTYICMCGNTYTHMLAITHKRSQEHQTMHCMWGASGQQGKRLRASTRERRPSAPPESALGPLRRRERQRRGAPGCSASWRSLRMDWMTAFSSIPFRCGRRARGAKEARGASRRRKARKRKQFFFFSLAIFRHAAFLHDSSKLCKYTDSVDIQNAEKWKQRMEDILFQRFTRLVNSLSTKVKLQKTYLHSDLYHTHARKRVSTPIFTPQTHRTHTHARVRAQRTGGEALQFGPF